MRTWTDACATATDARPKATDARPKTTDARPTEIVAGALAAGRNAFVAERIG